LGAPDALAAAAGVAGHWSILMAEHDLVSNRPARGRVGYAGGAFDLFHVGHLNILKHARSECDFLIAGVVSDEILLATKGSLPVVPLSERLEIVRSVVFVDEAIAETELDKLDTWRATPFDVYFKGGDWKGTERGRHLERQFAAVGVEIVYFPYTMTTSSTVLRQALAALADAETAVQVEGAQ
jgi:glycerol-3-phosphate cytidylyltransferase